MEKTVAFEEMRLSHCSTEPELIELVKRNYRIYRNHLKSMVRGNVTRRSVITTVQFYRRLLKSKGLPFSASA